MAKFKNGDAVKLRDDVEYGKMYNKITLLEEVKKSTKYHIDEVANPNSRSGPDYKILELDTYVGEDALEAWPESTEESHPVDEARKEANDRIQRAKNFQAGTHIESTEETISNEIDPQLFELVRALLTGTTAQQDYAWRSDLVTETIAVAKETLRLLREEKL